MQGTLPKLVNKRLVTLAEAAAYLGCANITVRRLIWNGLLPVVRWDRRQRVDIRDLEKFVMQHKTRESL